MLRNDRAVGVLVKPSKEDYAQCHATFHSEYVSLFSATTTLNFSSESVKLPGFLCLPKFDHQQERSESTLLIVKVADVCYRHMGKKNIKVQSVK